MVLFLHNRYRTTGGEERVVEDLLALVREQLGEQAELLGRDSATLGRARRGGSGCCAGACAQRRWRARCGCSGARVVHAHNLNPTLGWRALAAAREAGRARRAAPAPVPARLRDRRVLHARSGVHPLPRAQHAAGGAAELPRQPARGGRLRRRRWRCGSGAWSRRPTR